MKSLKIKLNKIKKEIHIKISKKSNILLQKPLINYIKVNNNNYKSTIVDICKIYTDINKKILIGFTFSNCYGAKFYIKNKINQSIQFLYPNYIKQNLKQYKMDISYIKHTNANNPVTLVSTYPFVQNENFKESMQNTFIKFIKHINGKPDPSNEGKVFLIHNLPDYIIDTPQKEKLFLHICKNNKLKDYLK
jgi:hypothetical protein